MIRLILLRIGVIRNSLQTLEKLNTVKPVLETTYIKRPLALRDHYSDTTTLLKST